MASEQVMMVLCMVSVFGFGGLVKAEGITNFEDLTLAAQSYWNGSDGSGGFASGSAWFNNNYDAMYGSWDGFAYSNMSDTADSEWMTGQYDAITGSGQGGSANYAVGFAGWTEPPRMVLDEPGIISGMYITNNNYAYYSMLNGGLFGAKKFGDGDWFLLTITGKDASGNVTSTVPFYLADFRDGKSEIVNDWQYVNLASLGVVKSVEFSLSSTDNDPVFGMNTPGYFVIDTVVPEPATFVLLGFGAVMVAGRRNG
ncbi:MAG: DUF4465 domain-containing protein [Sedimentisphaerales bacterium]|jgi:hypothetical protein